jgi:hypothetical protein
MKPNGVDDALELLAPVRTFEHDWQDVLRRASEPPLTGSPRRGTSRRPSKRLLSVALAAAVLTPIGILAASQERWLFESQPSAPHTPPPLVVETGAWNGQAWALVAYRDDEGDLCFSMNLASQGLEAAPKCTDFMTGVGETPKGELAINYLNDSSPELRSYIIGPVVAAAAEIEIELVGGELRTSTFDAPASLGPVRFYAVQVPETINPAESNVAKLVGLDDEGNTVACLAVDGGSTCE